MATCPQCRRRYSDSEEYCQIDGSSLMPDETFSSVDRDLAAGDMVGEYRVDRIIGKGSFGVVYKAVHPVIGKAAAIKILKREFSSNPQMVARFIAEARAVNQIRHRNIVDIFSFGVYRDGRQYYVMELLEGEPLDQFLARRGPVPLAEALPILDRISRALDAAHGAGIVHRDLKPGNVFLADDEGARFPKLLDFGVAKLTRENEKHNDFRTTTGAMLGTPHYMSPEQCRGDAIDYRTDVYSFGVMIHQMLTGRLPFDSDSILKVMNLHNSATPPSMSEDNASLSPKLDAPVLRMLEKEPALRPASAVEACRELGEAARAAGLSVPPIPASSNRAMPNQATAPAFDSGRPPAIRAAGTLDAQTLSTPPPRRLVMLTTVLTTGALAAIGAALVVTHLRSPMPIASASAGPSEETSSPVRQKEPPTTAPLPPSADVRFSVQSVPPGAEAFLDGRSLGTAPGPLVLPRGDKPITLQFKATGYRPKGVDITPSADGVVSVTLSPASAAPPSRPHQKRPVDDLEF
ncbi:MAG TPA: protein kinase [Polyangiaceae bacterium]|nr:protein kinase [Polyangiaceae bacterium]